MKILVFTDIHGSLNSLLSLKETEDFKNADKVIFLGDAVIGCSRPNECIELITKLNCECVVGNNDCYVCDHVPSVDQEEFSSEKIEQLRWMCNNVTEENKKILNSWNKSLEFVINDKKFYFTHYAWENYNNDVNVVDNPVELNFNSRKEMFEGIDADYYIFGHEHKTNYFTNGIRHYYCLGSLGLKNPGCYLVINIDENAIELHEKFVEFDLGEEIDLMDKKGYPYDKNKIRR